MKESGSEICVGSNNTPFLFLERWIRIRPHSLWIRNPDFLLQNWVRVMRVRARCLFLGFSMIFILDSNAEIGAYVLLISRLSYLFKAFVQIERNYTFFCKADMFSFTRAHWVLNYHLLWLPWVVASPILVRRPKKIMTSQAINKFELFFYLIF